MHGKKDTGLYEYYTSHIADHEPNGYTYVAGLGFAPPPMPSQERKLIRSYSTIIGAALVLFSMGSGLLYQLIHALLTGLATALLGELSYGAAQLLDEVAGSLSYAIAMLVPTLSYCKRIRIPGANAFPLGRPNPSLALASVPILLMVTVVGSYCGTLIGMVTGLFGFMPVSPDYLPPQGVMAFAVFFVSNTILPAILEELLFRGAILQSLRRFGDGFALLVSAVLFGLVHGNLLQAPMAFLSGLALGYFTLRTGSLYTGILAHFVNNALAVILGLLIENRSLGTQLFTMHVVYLLYLALGLLATAYVVHNHPNMFRLHSPRSRTGEREKLRAFFTTPGIWLFFVAMAIYSTQYLIVLY